MKNSCLKLYWLQDLVCILWVRQLIHRGRFLSIMKGGTSQSTYSSTILDKKILSFWTHPAFHFKLNSVSSSSIVYIYIHILGGGFQYFLIFTPILEEIEEMIQFGQSVLFFRWVETNHQLFWSFLGFPGFGLPEPFPPKAGTSSHGFQAAGFQFGDFGGDDGISGGYFLAKSPEFVWMIYLGIHKVDYVEVLVFHGSSCFRVVYWNLKTKSICVYVYVYLFICIYILSVV